MSTAGDVTFGSTPTLDAFGVPIELRRGFGGGPLIPQPGASPHDDGVLYKRCTTFIKALDDGSGLAIWKQRMTALGLVKDEALIKAARAATYDDKAVLKEVCEAAMTLAGAGQKATHGTALHKLTEIVDAGGELPDSIDPQDRADIAAYQRATARFRKAEAETFVVHDGLRVAGTFDRILETADGRRYIGDLKTGRVDKSTFGSQAMQLAVYANSERYEVQTNTRHALNVDLDHAVVIHVPAGSGQARLVWLDIRAGWQAVQLAAEVWQWRQYASKVTGPRGSGETALVKAIEDAV